MIVDDADHLASFATHAPDTVRGMTTGANSLNVFFASVVAGRIGGLYEAVSATTFWLIHAAVVASGGLALVALCGDYHGGGEPS
jgi:POT family proton-dependent oligopeptide transporter